MGQFLVDVGAAVEDIAGAAGRINAAAVAVGSAA